MTARRRVLITGASRGIGRATALALAGSGFDLVLWSRSAAALADVAADCTRLGARVAQAAVDVGDGAAVAAAARATLDHSDSGTAGGLAGLVLNAGHGVWTALNALSAAEWQGTLDTNLSGGFHVLRACLPHLADGSNPLLVGILSDSALYPFAGRAAYAASKAGLRALLDIARLELRPRGVRVSLLFPSRVDTFFSGSHAQAEPGSRPGALSADQVALMIKTLFDLPPSIEVREVQMTALTSSFGPFPAQPAADRP